jgi:hypothetical protein
MMRKRNIEIKKTGRIDEVYCVLPRAILQVAAPSRASNRDSNTGRSERKHSPYISIPTATYRRDCQHGDCICQDTDAVWDGSDTFQPRIPRTAVTQNEHLW